MLGHGHASNDVDFGDQLYQYVTLVDPNHNEFEVLVERYNGGMYLTKGWSALRDFYNICFGAWVTMVFVRPGKFGINLKDRFGKLKRYPKFTPPMKFVIEKQVLPFHQLEMILVPFVHNDVNFEHKCEKRLTQDDVDSGFLVIDVLLSVDAYHTLQEYLKLLSNSKLHY